MHIKSIVKNWLIEATGFWIYKKKHLPVGIDLFIDLENHFSKENVDVVFDIGANEGQSAQAFVKSFPRLKVYSFEPEMKLFKKMKGKTSKLNNVFSFNIGMGAVKEKKELYHGKYSAWNSLVPGLNDDSNQVSTVEIDTVDGFIADHSIEKIDLLKTDTEGYDLKVLKGAECALRDGKIKFVYIESGFYALNRRNTNFSQIMDYLSAFDFYLFGIYDVAKGSSHMVNGNSLFVNTNMVKEPLR